ncbi:hypothetical protein GOV08_02030 [Candidatus Woesearchaeota archaeon]|nr:hypothetical protein [Candidatus Woesearchaeota archaeon]
MGREKTIVSTGNRSDISGRGDIGAILAIEDEPPDISNIFIGNLDLKKDFDSDCLPRGTPTNYGLTRLNIKPEKSLSDQIIEDEVKRREIDISGHEIYNTKKRQGILTSIKKELLIKNPEVKLAYWMNGRFFHISVDGRTPAGVQKEQIQKKGEIFTDFRSIPLLEIGGGFGLYPNPNQEDEVVYIFKQSKPIIPLLFSDNGLPQPLRINSYLI